VPVGNDAGGIFLQLGAFGSRENAENFLARMKVQIDWLSGALQVFSRDGLFRVQAGPYPRESEARRDADRIGQALGVKPFVLTR
jgi:rare lipoprotein A